MKIALGGPKSSPAPKSRISESYGPNTSSDYMVKGVVVDTNLHNNGLYNLPNKTKYFENHSTASSTTTDVKTTHRDESKIVKTENLAPKVTHDVIEHVSEAWKYENFEFDIKYLLNNGWEMQSIGELVTQNGEERSSQLIQVDTLNGVIRFSVDATKDVAYKLHTEKTTYIIDVVYKNKALNEVKKVTYKYSFFGIKK